MRVLNLWACLLLLALSFSYCSENSTSPKPQPLDKNEALAFADKIETAVYKKNPRVFDSMFSIETFAQKLGDLKGVKISKKNAKHLGDGIARGNLGKQIIAQTVKGGGYDFIHYYEKDKKHHVIFRLYGEGGINYHDMELVKMNDEVKVADMYIYMTGENFSQTIYTLMNTMADFSDKEGNSETDRQLKNLVKLRSLAHQQQYEAAKREYDKFPQEFKDQKLFRVLYLTILSQLDMEDYRQELNRFEKDFANDASASLTLLDSYFLNGDYNKALEAIDKLDRAVDGDPLLNYYRALAYSQMKETDKTIACLEKLQQEMPGFGDGQLELIAHYIESNQRDKARLLMSSYKGNKEFDQDKLENIRYLYPDFAE